MHADALSHTLVNEDPIVGCQIGHSVSYRFQLCVIHHCPMGSPGASLCKQLRIENFGV
jgi:hypothetical protein